MLYNILLYCIGQSLAREKFGKNAIWQNKVWQNVKILIIVAEL